MKQKLKAMKTELRNVGRRNIAKGSFQDDDKKSNSSKTSSSSISSVPSAVIRAIQQTDLVRPEQVDTTLNERVVELKHVQREMN